MATDYSVCVELPVDNHLQSSMVSAIVEPCNPNINTNININQDICVINKKFSIESYQKAMELNSDSTYNVEGSAIIDNDRSLLTFHVTPSIPINTMPPPPHLIVNNFSNNNNNPMLTNFNKRGHWKMRPDGRNTPLGYESDESCRSRSSRDTTPENTGMKHKNRIGHQFPYEQGLLLNKFNNNVPNVIYNPLSMNENTYNRTRYYANGTGRSRRDGSKRHTGEIFRRVHGLMERFTAKSILFHLNVNLPSGFKNILWDNLSQSVWAVFCTEVQKEETYMHKLDLWKKVYLHIRRLFDHYGLFMVGSSMCGYGTDKSDVDICLLVRPLSTDPRHDALFHLQQIKNVLIKCDFIKSVEMINAKVPILKCKDNQFGFEIDLNCNNAVGIRNTHLLHCYGQLDWRVRPLVIIVKLWAQANRINDAKNMTISSYSISLMVIHYLQCGVSPPLIPCLHGIYPNTFVAERGIHKIDIQEELPPFYSDNNQGLGDLLLGFLHYYTYFSYDSYAISVRLGCRVPIDECRYVRSPKNDHHQWKFLCIEEPFDLTNTARSVYDLETFKRIKRVFQFSYNVLSETRNLFCILSDVEQNQR